MDSSAKAAWLHLPTDAQLCLCPTVPWHKWHHPLRTRPHCNTANTHGNSTCKHTHTHTRQLHVLQFLYNFMHSSHHSSRVKAVSVVAYRFGYCFAFHLNLMHSTTRPNNHHQHNLTVYSGFRRIQQLHKNTCYTTELNTLSEISDKHVVY